MSLTNVSWQAANISAFTLRTQKLKGSIQNNSAGQLFAKAMVEEKPAYFASMTAKASSLGSIKLRHDSVR